MADIKRVFGIFVVSLIFFTIVGFLLSIIIPLLLAHLPQSMSSIVGTPVRIAEKILPGGLTIFGMAKNLIYALIAAIVKGVL